MASRCAICGTENEIPIKSNVEAVEPPDFDTRPGEPLRSTISTWVEYCQFCTYCADDITSAHSRAQEITQSDPYQQIYLDRTLPEKARHSLCYACLLDKLRQHADAGWSGLHAAWICDDLDDFYAASRCRAQAIEYWKRGKHAGQAFSDDLASEYALVADVHRRMAEFELANVTCSEALDLEDVPPVIEQILRRQKSLIEQKDIAAHSLKELLAPAGRQ